MIRNTTCILMAAVTAISLTGCNTMETQNNQTAVAVGGCVAGALLGALINGGRGAAIGCAGGALVGWSAVRLTEYNSQQARSYSSDQKKYARADPDFYGLNKAVTSPAVRIRKASSSPTKVKQGGSLLLNTDYSVVMPSGMNEAKVKHSWTLTKDGRRLSSVDSPTETRTAGGWNSKAEITIPDQAEPGTYYVEHRVKIGSTYDTETTSFVVRG